MKVALSFLVALGVSIIVSLITTVFGLPDILNGWFSGMAFITSFNEIEKYNQ